MDQPHPFALRIRISTPLAEAERRARELLAEEGFGVLTEIDVSATLQAKLGLETAPCRILGACNPAFAHRALELEPQVSVLLPCNVVIREMGSHREVAALDPTFMGAVLPRLEELSREVGRRIRRVLDRLEAEASAGGGPSA
jgi:uncharacterized protein (DUF302 family)